MNHMNEEASALTKYNVAFNQAFNTPTAPFLQSLHWSNILEHNYKLNHKYYGLKLMSTHYIFVANENHNYISCQVIPTRFAQKYMQIIYKGVWCTMSC